MVTSQKYNGSTSNRTSTTPKSPTTKEDTLPKKKTKNSGTESLWTSVKESQHELTYTNRWENIITILEDVDIIKKGDETKAWRPKSIHSIFFTALLAQSLNRNFDQKEHRRCENKNAVSQ